MSSILRVLGLFSLGLTIAACAGFGAICGSSIATAATMARVAMPEMRRFGYRDSFAAGAIEGLTSVLALREGFLPPTVNLERPDPACALDFVPRHARAASLQHALSNSYGFGGNNTAVVLGRA